MALNATLYYRNTFVNSSVALEMANPSFNIIRFLHNQKHLKIFSKLIFHSRTGHEDRAEV